MNPPRMNTDKHGLKNKNDELCVGRARHSVRAVVFFRTNGGQRTLMDREQAARPTRQSMSYPCPSVSIRG